MQTTEFKDATAEFDESIKACVKEDSHWSDYMDYDADFQAEFDAAVNDPDVPEAKRISPQTCTTTTVSIWSWRSQGTATAPTMRK